jgi:hypothetical protein
MTLFGRTVGVASAAADESEGGCNGPATTNAAAARAARLRRDDLGRFGRFGGDRGFE